MKAINSRRQTYGVLEDNANTPGRPSSSTAYALGDNLHLKMSKKIAQLTKVIYHLNTKNEDHSSSVIGLQKSYENEIDQILKDAYNKMNKYKEQVESEYNKGQYEERVREIEGEKKKEVEAIKAEMERALAKGRDREKSIETALGVRVQEMAKDVAQAKERFKRRVGELEAAVRKGEMMAEEKAEAAERRAKSEVESVVKMSNEEVNRIMKERFESEDKIRVSLAAERSHVLERERRKHHHELNELEQDRNQLRNQIEHVQSVSQGHIADLTAKLQQAEKWLKQDKDNVSRLLKEHEKIITQMKSTHNENMKQTRAELADIQQALSDQESAHNIMIEQHKKEMGNQIDRSAATIENMKKQIVTNQEKYQEEHKAIMVKYENDAAKKDEKIKNMEDDAKRREQVLEKNQIMMSAMLRDKDQLKLEYDKMMNDKKIDKTEWEMMRVEMMQQHERREREIIETSSLKYDQELQETLGRMRTRHDQEMKSSLAQWNTEKQEMIEQRADLEQQYKEINQKAMNDISLLNHQLKQAENEHEQYKITMDDELKKRTLEQSNERIRIEKEHRQQYDQLRLKNNGEIHTMNMESDKRLIQEKEQWRIEREQIISNIRYNNKDINDQLQQQISDIQQEYSYCKNELERANEQIINHIEKNKQCELKIVRQDQEILQVNAVLNKSNTALADAKREHKEEMDRLQLKWSQETMQIRKSLEDSNLKCNQLMEKASNDHERALGEALELQHKQFQDKFEQQNELSQSRMESAIAEAQKQAALTQEQHISKLGQEYWQQIQEINNNHQKSMDSQRMDYDVKTQEMIGISKHNEQLRLNEERAEHQSQIEENNTKHDNEIKQLQTQIANYQGKLEELQSHHKKEIGELQAMLEGKKIELHRARINQTNLERRIVCLEEEDKETAEKHLIALERQEKERRWEMQCKQNEMERMKTDMESELGRVRLRMDEVETRLRNRESRREDLERIEELEKISIQQQRIVDQTIMDKNMFKLELQNRDKNYNEMFAATPKVGIMQVLRISLIDQIHYKLLDE